MKELCLEERKIIAILVLSLALGLLYFWPNKPTSLSFIPNPFASLIIEAKSAYVFDLENQKMLFGRHEETSLPIASITKIMTAIVVLENFDLEDKIFISENALAQEGDNSLFLNERWRLIDLIKFMLLASSNDAAYAISEKDPDFVNKMNVKAKELGLSKTYFNTSTGLDLGDKLGGVSSAKDIAYLLYYAYSKYPDIFGVTSKEEVNFISLDGLKHEKIKNTNLLVKNGNFLASKTGLTKSAGGTLVGIIKEPKPLLISVLGSTQEGRFVDAANMAAAAALTK